MPVKQSKKQIKSDSLTANVYNLKGVVTGKITLPKEIFAVKVSPNLLATAVRVHLANQRAGTHKTKTRSEVVGSTRKIYRQKGTGRARHGDIKAPIFVHGGVAHGPRPRDYSLKFPQKMKKLALKGALTDKLTTDSIKIIKNLPEIAPKTKNMFNLLKNLKLTGTNDKNVSILLVTDKVRQNVYLSGRNITDFTILPYNQLNTYEVLKNRNLILMKEIFDPIRTKEKTE